MEKQQLLWLLEGAREVVSNLSQAQRLLCRVRRSAQCQFVQEALSMAEWIASRLEVLVGAEASVSSPAS